MKTAAIITEYNPFHNGHKHQVDSIRKLIGDDTAVIAIMSGNFTQRGELAVADKTVRARAAIDSGVNLVLELPFPYSISSAEFFACAGVRIANALGVVDYLVFGSESGDIDMLTETAHNMLSDEFALALHESESLPEYANLGYPKLCEITYNRLFKNGISRDTFSPNNILAIEYMKALIRENSKIIPMTIKREGAGYNDFLNESQSLQSATALRALIKKGDTKAFEYMPDAAAKAYIGAINEKKCPSDEARLDSAVISHFRLNSPKDSTDIHDALGGLYNRLCNLSSQATSISSLTSMTETKKYTSARIRRAMWNSFFGVTSSDVRTSPAYTQVLGLDAKGRSLLKRIKKMSDFTVITKPSSYPASTAEVIRQKELSNKADSIFALSLECPDSSAFALSFTPYVKK